MGATLLSQSPARAAITATTERNQTTHRHEHTKVEKHQGTAGRSLAAATGFSAFAQEGFLGGAPAPILGRSFR